MGMAVESAHGANFVWDPLGLGAGGSMSGGTWVLGGSSTNWLSGGTYQNWADNNAAIFGGPFTQPTTVTVDSNVKITSLTFNTAGYTIAASATGVVQLNLGATPIVVNADAVMSAGMSGAGVGFAKQGTGALTLSGASSFTGTTLVSAGVLQVGDGTGNGRLLVSSPITISTGANLRFNGADITTGAYTGALSGDGTLEVVGGEVRLNGNGSAFTGLTKVSAGTMQFGKVAALYGGDSSKWTEANIVVESGGTLALSVGGTGDFSSANISALAATGSASGGFKSGAILGLSTATSIAPSFSFAGVLADPNGGANALGLSKLGANTLILSGLNTYTGVTTVKEGVLQVAGPGVLYGGLNGWTASKVVVESGATLSLPVGGASDFTAADVAFVLQRLGVDPGSGGLRSGSLLGLDTTNAPGGTFTLSASFADGTGVGASPLGVSKLGTGSLVLTGTSTYSGRTVVGGGTLEVGSGGTSGSILNTSEVNLAAGAGLKFNRTDSYGGAQASVISGEGSLEVAKGTLSLTGLSTYSGTTKVGQGATLVINSLSTGGTSALGTGTLTGDDIILDGGKVQYSGTGSSNSRRLTVTEKGATIESSGRGSLSMSLLEVLFTGNGDRIFTLGGTRVGNLSGTSVGGNTFSGVIGDSIVRDGNGDPILDAFLSPTVLGSTHLVKEGPGTWVINPLTNSTYSGTTRINGGTLVVSTLDSFLFQGSSLGSSDATASNLVINGGTLRIQKGAGAYEETDRSFTIGPNGATIDSADSVARVYFNGLNFANDYIDFEGDTAHTLTLKGYSPSNNRMELQITDFGSYKTSLIKSGPRVWELSRNRVEPMTYTGDTVVQGGMLSLDLNGLKTGRTLISTSSRLVLEGATLSISGQDNLSQTQGFAGVLLKPGASNYVVTVSGTNGRLTNTFGAISRQVGATLDLVYDPASSSKITLNSTQANLGTTGILGAYVTVNGADWAAVSAGKIVPLATASYTNVLYGNAIQDGASTNVRINEVQAGRSSDDVVLNGSTVRINTLLQNYSGAGAADAVVDLAGGTLRFSGLGGAMIGRDKKGLTLGKSVNPGVITAGDADNQAGELLLSNLNANGELFVVNSRIANNGSGALTLVLRSAPTLDQNFITTPGTIILNGANTFSGGTYVNEGFVRIASGSALGSGPITFGSGGSSILADNRAVQRIVGIASTNTTTRDIANALVFKGDTIIGDKGTILGVAGTGLLNFSGTVDLGGDTRFLTINPAYVSLFGVVSNGGLAKVGTGTLALLNSANNFSGNLYLNEGNLDIVPGGLGSGLVFLNGGALSSLASLNGAASARSIQNDVSVTGDFQIGRAGLGQGTDLGGSFDLNGVTAATRKITVSTTGVQQRISGSINGGGFTKVGLGELIISGSNNFADGLVVAQGTVRITGTGTTGLNYTTNLVSIRGGLNDGESTMLALSGPSNFGSAQPLALNGGGASRMAMLALGSGFAEGTGNTINFASSGGGLQKIQLASGQNAGLLLDGIRYADDVVGRTYGGGGLPGVWLGATKANGVFTGSVISRNAKTPGFGGGAPYRFGGGGGTLTIASTNALTGIGPILVGSDGVANQGAAGTLFLPQSQSYAGEVIVGNGGTLVVGKDGAFGSKAQYTFSSVSSQEVVAKGNAFAEITGISDTSSLTTGMLVSGSGIAPGTTISSIVIGGPSPRVFLSSKTTGPVSSVTFGPATVTLNSGTLNLRTSGVFGQVDSQYASRTLRLTANSTLNLDSLGGANYATLELGGMIFAGGQGSVGRTLSLNSGSSGLNQNLELRVVGPTYLEDTSTGVSLVGGATGTTPDPITFVLDPERVTVTDTSGLAAGMVIVGKNIPAGTTVVSVDPNRTTFTMSAAATGVDAGPLSFLAGSTAGSTFTINGGGSSASFLTFVGPILQNQLLTSVAAPRSLTFSPSSTTTIVLGADNQYGGTTAVNSGTVVLANAGAAGMAGNGVSLGGATLGLRADASTTFDFGTLTIGGAGRALNVGRLTKSGVASTLSFDAITTTTTADLTITGERDAAFKLNGALTLGGNFNLNVRGARAEIGAVSGTFSLTKGDTGLLVLSGARTQGTSFINRGTVLVRHDSGAGAADVFGTALDVSAGGSSGLFLAGARSYASAITLSGNSAASNQVFGGIEAGAKTFGTLTMTGTSATVTNKLFLTAEGGAITFGGVISQGTAGTTAGLEVQVGSTGSGIINGNLGSPALGIGTVNLTAANTFSGNFTLNSGTAVGTAVLSTLLGGPFGVGSTLVLNGGSLQLNGAATGTKDTVFTNSSLAPALNVAGGARVGIANVNNQLFTQFRVGSLNRVGGGTLVLSPNTDDFGAASRTRFSVQSAPSATNGILAPWTVLTAASGGGSAADFAAVSVSDVQRFSAYVADSASNTSTSVVADPTGRTLAANRTAYALKLGGSLLLNNFTYNLGAASGSAMTAFAGLILNGGASISGGTLQFGATEVDLYNDSASAISANLVGRPYLASGLTKFGPGTLTLSGSNGYRGPTFVNEGALVFGGTSTLPRFTEGGTLKASALTIGTLGSVNLGGNSMEVASLAGNYGAVLTFGGSNSLIVGRSNAATTFAGQISAASGTLTKVGTGRLILDNTRGDSTANSLASLNVDEGQVRLYITDQSSGTPYTAANSLPSATAINLRGGSLELYSSGDNSSSQQTLTAGYNITVSGGNSTLSSDRAGASESNKLIELGSLSLGRNSLTVSNGNSIFAKFAGATTLTSPALIIANSEFVLEGPIGDGGLGYTLNKTGGNVLYLNSPSSTYSGGTMVAAGTLIFGTRGGDPIRSPGSTFVPNSLAKAGTGDIFLLNSATVRLNDSGNLNAGQSLRVINTSLVTPPIVDIRSDRPLSSYRISAAGSGVLALGTGSTGGSTANPVGIFANPIDLASLGDGTWGLSASQDTIYTPTVLGPGAGNNYRFYGTSGATLVLQEANVLTGKAGLVVGRPLTDLGVAQGNMSVTVRLTLGQNLTGSTVIYRGNNRGGYTGRVDARGTIASTTIENYGRLEFNGNGRLTNDAGVQLGTFIARPGSSLRLSYDDDLAGFLVPTGLGASNAGTFLNKWQDSLPVVLDGSQLELANTPQLQNVETIGGITFGGGSEVRLERRGANGLPTLIVQGPLSRVGLGTLAIRTSDNDLLGLPGALGTVSAERLILGDTATLPARGSASGSVVNMVSPRFFNIGQMMFLDYDPAGTTGFSNASFFGATTTVTGGTGSTVITLTGNTVASLGLVAGMPVTGANIPIGATIASVNSAANTVTLSATPTATLTQVTFSGTNSSTFNNGGPTNGTAVLFHTTTAVTTVNAGADIWALRTDVGIAGVNPITIRSGGLATNNTNGLTIAAPLVFANNGTPVEADIWTNSGNNGLILTGAVSASNLTKNGLGRLVLAGASPSLTGQVQTNGGTLEVRGAPSLGAVTDVRLHGSYLNNDGTYQMPLLEIRSDGTSTATHPSTGFFNSTVTVAEGIPYAELYSDRYSAAGSNLTMSIRGLTVEGGGAAGTSLSLRNGNDYDITVDGATRLGLAGRTAPVSLNVQNNNGTNQVILAGPLLGGTPTVIKNGNGPLRLVNATPAATNTFAGTIVLNEGTLELANQITLAVTNSSGTTQLTGLPSTANFYNGMAVTGTNVGANSVLSSFDAAARTATLSVNSTAAVTSATFSPPSITLTGLVNTAGASTVAVSSAAGLSVGMIAVGNGIPIGATITGISGTTVTLSAPSSAAVSLTGITNTSGSSLLSGLSSVSNLAVGMTVTGDKVAANSTITAIDPIAKTVTLSAITTGAVTAASFVVPVSSASFTVANNQLIGPGSIIVNGNNGSRSMLRVVSDTNYFNPLSLDSNSLTVTGQTTLQFDRFSGNGAITHVLGGDRAVFTTQGSPNVLIGGSLSAIWQGRTVINDNPIFNIQGPSLQLGGGLLADSVTGQGRILKTGPNPLIFNSNAANTFSGGLDVFQGFVRAGTVNDTFGSGPIRIAPGTGLALMSSANLPATGPGSLTSYAVNSASHTILALRPNSNLTINSLATVTAMFPSLRMTGSSTQGALLANDGGGTNFFNWLNGSDLSTLGNGSWFIGSLNGNAEINGTAAIGAGSPIPGVTGGVYRFGGGGANVFFNPSSAASVLVNNGATPNRLLVGKPYALAGNGIVYFNGNINNTYSGGTTISRVRDGSGNFVSSQLNVRSGYSSKPLGTGRVDVYGTLSFEGNGAAVSNAGGNTNLFTFHPGARLLIDNNSGGAYSNPTGNTNGRWGDAEPISLNSSSLELIGNTTATSPYNVETVGALTFSGGSILRSAYSGSASTDLILNSITRAGTGSTLLLDHTSGKLGTAAGTGSIDRIKLTTVPSVANGLLGSNNMVSPFILSRADSQFLKYDATLGFQFVTQGTALTGYVATTTTPLSGTVNAALTNGIGILSYDSTSAATLGANLDLYALRTQGDINSSAESAFTQITIRSGGLTLYGGTARTIKADLIFGTAAAPAEALIHASSAGLTIDGQLTASSVTKFGTSTLTINQDQKSIAGAWNLNGGSLIVQTPGGLGTSSNPVNLNGSSGTASGLITNELRLNFNSGSPDELVFTSGKISTLENNQIRFQSANDRTARIAALDLKAVTPASSTLAIPGNLWLRVDGLRSRLNTGAMTLFADYNLHVDAGNYSTPGSTVAVAPDSISNGGLYNLSKTGDGVLLLGNNSNLTGARTFTVSEGAVKVLNNNSLGAAGFSTVVENGGVLDVGVSNFTPPSTVSLQPGAIERWSANNARPTGYTLGPGVHLQVAADQTGTAAYKLNGGSIMGYLPLDVDQQMVVATLGSNVSFELQGDSSVGQPYPAGTHVSTGTANQVTYDMGKANLMNSAIDPKYQGSFLRVMGNITAAAGLTTPPVLTKLGQDHVVLGGSNSGFDTTVREGTLFAGSTDTLPTDRTLSVVSDGAFDLNGFSVTVGALQGNSTAARVLNSSTVPGTLTVNGGGTYTGTLQGNLALSKGGSQTLALSANHTYTGATTIEQGTLSLSGSLSKTGSVEIRNGGTLALAASTVPSFDRINDAASLTIRNGGTFATNGLSEGVPTFNQSSAMGALSLEIGAAIDFGTGALGSTLFFQSLASVEQGGTITILNWTGSPLLDDTTATNDRLLFKTAPSFSRTQLAQIQFKDDSGNLYPTGAALIDYSGYSELVPVPEPSTWILGGLALGLLGYRHRRQLLRALRSQGSQDAAS